jgi:hypothetical protein
MQRCPMQLLALAQAPLCRRGVPRAARRAAATATPMLDGAKQSSGMSLKAGNLAVATVVAGTRTALICWLLVAGCWLLVAGCWLLVDWCELLEEHRIPNPGAVGSNPAGDTNLCNRLSFDTSCQQSHQQSYSNHTRQSFLDVLRRSELPRSTGGEASSSRQLLVNPFRPCRLCGMDDAPQPCQGWGRGFESLRPLQLSMT